MSTGTPIEAGMYMAVYFKKYQDEEPQIRQVATVSPDSDDLVVNWHVGCYSGPWKVCMQGGGRGRRVWSETISSSTVLFPIIFTKTMKLGKETVSKLKLKYASLRD